ncbi:MAG: hypothetical protein ABI684_11815, partial [Nitrospirota bacterium]
FREQEDDQATLPIFPRPRVARAQKIISLHPFLCSVSEKDTWPLPTDWRLFLTDGQPSRMVE